MLPQASPPAATRGSQKGGPQKWIPLQGLWQHLAHPRSVLETPSTLETPAKDSCKPPSEAKLEA